MKLSDRSLGWLRHLDRKSHTPDDRGGGPHPHWSDAASTRPLHLELVDPAYALGMMAHRTPAWTERYVSVLDQLIDRHTRLWSAADWLATGRGGSADGDPIAADAMFPDAGYFLILLGIRALVDPDHRGDRPYGMIGNGRADLTWTHTAVAEHVCRRWSDPDHDLPADVVTMAAAGLGLKLHDTRFDTDLHREAFMPWWAKVRACHLDPTRCGPAHLTAALHLAPQVPEDARTMFDAACSPAVLGPTLGPTPTADHVAALLLAREWGLTDLEQKLADAIDAAWRPIWDVDRGEFTRRLELPEQGSPQWSSGLMAAADTAGPGRWTALATSPVPRGPRVVDIDAAALALSRAEWIDGALHLTLEPLREDLSMWTTFRVVGAEPRLWYLTGIGGATMDVTSSSVIVRLPLVGGDLEFTPGSY